MSVARRLGAAVRAARRARGLRQSDAAGRAGLAQSSVSEFERGLGASFSLAAIARLAQAVGQRVYAGLEAIPGADPPRDAAHLAIQELVLRAAEPGPWRVLPEAPLERGERSIDVRLLHRTLRAAVVAEVWTWFADVGEATRGLDRKVAAQARELDRGRGIRTEPFSVVGLWIVRATKRNRALVRDHRAFFRARFPVPGDKWLRALAGEAPAPSAPGLLWVDLRGTRLWGARLA